MMDMKGYPGALKEMILDGQKYGEQIGQQRVNALNMLLVEKGRIQDMIQSAGDRAFQEELFAEFGL